MSALKLPNLSAFTGRLRGVKMPPAAKKLLSLWKPEAMLRKLKLFAGLVKIEHSVFALPFAYIGLFLAKPGWPGARAFVLLTLAMVAVRSFAMAVNRLADLKYDKINPRTKTRELVTGALSKREAQVFAGACAAVFVLACAGLNTTCLVLSPFALVWSGLYSFTKRSTWLCHLALGSVLGLAPLAGWLAVSPALGPAMVLFGLAVTCWVAGFDVLYACQDAGFDAAHKLKSMPVRFGVGGALSLAALLHANAVVLFAMAGWSAGLGRGFFAALAVVACVLAVEHKIITEKDLSRVNVAFFTLNGVVAALVFVGVLADVFWLR